MSITKRNERLLTILRSPHISEKATMLADKQRHIIFKVERNATKAEVKEAVKKLFSVEVESVNMINVKGKQRRFRERTGQCVSWKKAIVRLVAGQDINFLGKE